MLVNKKVFSQVESKLLTEEFISLFRSKIRSGLKLYKRNPDLIKFVSKYTGIPEEELKPIWHDIYKLLLDIYNKKKIKVKKKQEGGLGINTLANSLYYAVYDKYQDKTPEIMYMLLEPYMVPALSGESEEMVEKARLLFLPILPENMDRILSLLKEILTRNKDILCNDTVASSLEVVCSQTNKLPSSKTRSSRTKDTNYCLSKLKTVILEVCSRGREA